MCLERLEFYDLQPRRLLVQCRRQDAGAFAAEVDGQRIGQHLQQLPQYDRRAHHENGTDHMIRRPAARYLRHEPLQQEEHQYVGAHEHQSDDNFRNQRQRRAPAQHADHRGEDAQVGGSVSRFHTSASAP